MGSRYPGTAPEFLHESSGNSERRIDYSFRCTEEAWFDQRLNAAGFRVTSDFTGSGGGFVHSNTADALFHVELRDIQVGI